MQPSLQSAWEFVKKANEALDTGEAQTFKVNGQRYVVTLVKKKNYAVQRVANDLLGWALMELDGERILFPGYMHMSNFSGELPSSHIIVEVKYNGSNVGVMVHKGRVLIRSRRAIDPDVIILPYMDLNFIQNLSEPARTRMMQRRERLEEAAKKYPFILVQGDTVSLKMPDAFLYAVKKQGIDLSKLPEDMAFFFELYGWANPIAVDSDCEIGFYDDLPEPLYVVLIDVFDIKEMRFLDRKEKEIVASEHGIPVPEVVFEGSPEQFLAWASKAEKLAIENGWEGFVIKGEDLYIKLKPEEVLAHAKRAVAIDKGIILSMDLVQYVARGAEAVQYDPEKFDEAVAVAVNEALTDYPQNIVSKKRELIEFEMAKEFAKFYGYQIVQTWFEQGMSKREAFSKLNVEIVARLPFLKRWVDIEKEKELKERGDERWRELKKMRKSIMNPLIGYILKKMG